MNMQLCLEIPTPKNVLSFFFGALGLPGNIETSPLWNKTHKLTLMVMFKPKIIKGVSENFFKHSKKPIWRMWIHHTIGLRKCPEVLITDLLLPVFFFFFSFFRSKREFWSIKIVNFSTWIVPSQKISCNRVPFKSSYTKIILLSWWPVLLFLKSFYNLFTSRI